MGRRVGVVEGVAVEVEVVVAGGEAAEDGLGLAEADTVTGGGEGAGRHIDYFSVIGDGRSEVLNEGRGDDGARRVSIEQSIHGRKRGGDRADSISLDRDLLGDIAYVERNGDVHGLS